MLRVHASRKNSAAVLRQLWPLGAVLLGEGALLARLALRPLPVTSLSVGIALLITLATLLPALLRPGTASVLAACFGVLVASALLVPFDLIQTPPATLQVPFLHLPSGLLLRLVNTALLSPVALHLTAIFPRRQRVEQRLIRGSYACSLGLLLVVALAPRVFSFFAQLMLAGWCALLWVVALALLARTARSTAPADLRSAQQARLILGSVLLAELPLIVRIADMALGGDHVPYDLVLGTQIFLVLGLGYAVARLDLFGIDAALRRGLVYGVLSPALLLLYFGLTLLLTAALRAVLPAIPGLPASIALLVASALFQPLRARAQRLVDRLLYPARLTFQREIIAARAALAQIIARADVVALLTTRLPQRIDAAHARLGFGDTPQLVTPKEPGFSAALVVGGAQIGYYTLGPRRDGSPYDDDEREQLRALSQQAALTLGYAATYDELRTLNAELEQRVANRSDLLLEQTRALAALNERQRLARELHDSVTQTLFSISLTARALPKLLRRDPVAAASALTEQEAAAQRALAEMRDLLTQLRAPDSAQPAGERDLVQMLRAHCATLRQQLGLAVQLDLPAAALLPAALSNDLLRIAREALHNVVKHSGTHAARLTLNVTAHDVVLQIADDGSGFDPRSATGGFGLRGMRERVAGLGGTLDVRSAVGQGTTITVQVQR